MDYGEELPVPHASADVVIIHTCQLRLRIKPTDHITEELLLNASDYFR